MTATTKQIKHSLIMQNRTGTYSHKIMFFPQDDGMVRIIEVMHDQLMGDWIGSSQNRTIPAAEARAYYADRRKFNYQKA